MDIRTIFSKLKVIPVTVFDDVDSALRVTELLVKHKVGVIEVTLRTEKAFDCIKSIGREFKDIVVGAGSVLDTVSLQRAVDCGAVFAVAPSLDEKIVEYSNQIKIPFIPGVATPGELHRAIKLSQIIKIFPAKNLGGVDYINAITAPFRMMDFAVVPTGGIDNKNYKEYLSCDRVIACGLSYPVNEKLIKEKDFDSIEKRIVEIYGENN
ncbi:MAG TPA: bifunctional 4-hydroxy-2-oxoglutarate aldolase/2-dehydro-3-deoxy-phosphogluconate aldolase [Spirochaetota bacterium]|jgi:2-dehydro-3-deoxyphosphogluconate aldolase/(4S)-4-hydroxy-2-oxoglutarate aldolase|nr:bifunctional 4-hydroxy-2-oxoglutarate aldolase/2-dehydro-3-deoxy-phosphogluconate aldolase [Spirochaetota bacterium]OQA96637.1 MAG: putative KHG/KDPG aldolase [Spirochaetes bacterium ADurb.Bin218]HOK91992.1 bifunctional 4-hydroxy-2-oxoglutarate aldolase/2-dehydro-3-deoxy-phosphogluconate aldolase [Spirochaetota bacterium]HON15401.1 bifunctional 4-hydroxy-2-oxoglutarate aldolase/2-dehydro-3-deoxy-phosphogluconate aldolase [Spirochaetota bacterium]HOQ11836.1 bifunctional 4-hydroxy-2-oxoglutara